MKISLLVVLALWPTAAWAQFPPPFDPWTPSPVMRALVVTKAGSGTGTVTAQVGIDCGGVCTHSYNNGASVLLVATALGPNHAFQSWGGACSGSGACIVQMNQARAVTATFIFSWNLAWDDNSVNETGFQLERRSPCGASTFALLTSPLANVTTFRDETALPATSYEYRIRAVNAAGASAYSNTLCTP